MPLDAICLMAVKDELAKQITGMKIDKVQQPEGDVVVLALRGHSAALRLLISTGQSDTRVHLTKSRFDNPQSPPMFCMLLRKHITGAKICAVNQPPGERVLEIILEAYDAMGLACEKRLILELMGRLSNIILTDGDGIIIDCRRRIGGELTDKRRVLPGMLYRLPPGQNKLDPLAVTEEMWRIAFDSIGEKTADKWLLETFFALSPLICREISWRAYGTADYRAADISDGGDALRREFFALMNKVREGKLEPFALSDDEYSPRDFSYTRIMQYGTSFNVLRAANFSELLDEHFTRAAKDVRVRQRASATVKAVKNARDKLTRKLVIQREELKKTSDRDSLRESGDIITANLHLMRKGMRVLKASDFYSEENAEREIMLDPLKTPQQNAARYFREYTKAKNAEKFLTEQIRTGERELIYLESVLEELALAESERDLSEIRAELIQTGYIRKQEKKEKRAEAKPMMFVSSTGTHIRAGKNNTQNDTLTFKSAMKTDIWLHAQKIHGAHVIISSAGEEPDETTLYEAAVIAAYYSSARSGGKIPVDYCRVRYVKKPPGARPGMVLYTDYKTIVVNPDRELVERMSSKTK